jgi:hypothetical protein
LLGAELFILYASSHIEAMTKITQEQNSRYFVAFFKIQSINQSKKIEKNTKRDIFFDVVVQAKIVSLSHAINQHENTTSP